MIKGDRIREVEDSLIRSTMNEARCVVIVNNKTKRYTCLETDAFFRRIINPDGELEELYNSLFLHSKMNDIAERNVGEYRQFMDLSVFEWNQYRTNLRFIEENQEYDFAFIQARMNEDEVAVIIKDQDDFYNTNMIEKEKVDTIQESFLFSMIVDLSEDSCINPNTTEVSSDRQDFMDIKYSDWRIMISNMFKEQDKVLFLRASSPENVINILESKTRFHIDLQMMNMQGQYAWSRLNFARMKNFSREHPRFLYTVYDISEDMNQLLKQEGITKAVEEQNESLLRADKEKMKFFANLSHELRAPVNAMIGMNEIILTNSNEESVKEYAKDIKVAGEILLQLLNDVLDFSKIKAGKMEIVPVEYETEEMIHNVSNLIRYKIQNKSLQYEVRVEENVPKRLFGDEIRISQILINLLTNAVKYTEQGKITLTLRTAKDAQGMDAIEYLVEDTGCGIREEDMDKLFSDYGRLELERNRNVEGTGLGLGIVTGLLSAMNSSLQVESEYGKGSCFHFVLAQNYINKSPLKDVSKKDKKEEEVLNLKGRKILVVDDMDMNLKIIDVLLKKYEAETSLAKSGEEALALMKENRYDAIFLDHVMPGLNGVETLKRARQLDEYYKGATFIALTGNVSPTARDEYLSLGFTDYLEKPISPTVLKQLLKLYCM